MRSIQNKINASIINKKELGSSEVNTDPAISISSPPIKKMSFAIQIKIT